jgi:hypothetical protein
MNGERECVKQGLRDKTCSIGDSEAGVVDCVLWLFKWCQEHLPLPLVGSPRTSHTTFFEDLPLGDTVFGPS